MFVSALLMISAVPAPTIEQELERAFSSLNLYVEAIADSDTCLRSSDMRLVEAQQKRIAAMKARALAESPDVNVDAGKGETDYTCARAPDDRPHVSRRAIRAELDRLVREGEGLLYPGPKDVR